MTICTLELQEFADRSNIFLTFFSAFPVRLRKGREIGVPSFQLSASVTRRKQFVNPT
jgi:hypothetical protein